MQDMKVIQISGISMFGFSRMVSLIRGKSFSNAANYKYLTSGCRVSSVTLKSPMVSEDTSGDSAYLKNPNKNANIKSGQFSNKTIQWI